MKIENPINRRSLVIAATLAIFVVGIVVYVGLFGWKKSDIVQIWISNGERTQAEGLQDLEEWTLEELERMANDLEKMTGPATAVSWEGGVSSRTSDRWTIDWKIEEYPDLDLKKSKEYPSVVVFEAVITATWRAQ